MTETETLGAEIKRRLMFLIILTVVLYVVVTLGLLWVWHDSSSKSANIRDLAVTTAQKICALRRDVELRVKQSEEFLHDNPEGTSAIPKGAILISIANSKRTIKALSGLECPPPE